ncbi:MAG: TonB-dependent receptor, partial [Pseudomonadota bacterium]
MTAPASAQDDGEAVAGQGAVVLDPLTVTARRRPEDSQEAPAAVTVVQREDIGLGNIDTLEDVAFEAPNTVFNEQGGPLTIRGIGSLGIAGGVDRQPGVGVFLDDVFIARPFGYPSFLNDTERVEVVRGSQATLYGKNTIGGAVNLVTRDPGPVLSVEAEGSLGLDRQFEALTGRVTAAFDAPLGLPRTGNGLGIRGYASWTGSEGYIENDTGNGTETVSDIDTLTTRLVLAGQIGDATRVRISTDYSRERDDGGLWFAPLPLALDFKATHDFPGTSEVDIAGVTARVDHDFGEVDLTSITAFRGHELETILDGDFTNDPGFALGQAQRESQRQVSQDFRFATEFGRLGLRGGFFYMREWFEGDQFFDFASFPIEEWSRTTFDQTTDTVSVFGEASYAITPALEVVGGLRYTFDRKDTVSQTASPTGTFFLGAPGLVAETVSFNDVSPELSLSYAVTDDALLFAKASRGFKSGGISPFIDEGGTANRYDPERTTSIEVGAKTLWLADRLRVNGSVFYIDWEDQQQVIAITPTTRVIRNAASSRSFGVELEGAFQITENLLATGNYGYLNAEYEEFVDTVLGRDFSGNPLPYSPEHSAGMGLRWSQPVAAGISLNAGVDYSFRSSYSFNPDNLFRQDPTHLVDARIGVSGETWSATLWAKNLA